MVPEINKTPSSDKSFVKMQDKEKKVTTKENEKDKEKVKVIVKEEFNRMPGDHLQGVVSKKPVKTDTEEDDEKVIEKKIKNSKKW